MATYEELTAAAHSAVCEVLLLPKDTELGINENLSDLGVDSLKAIVILYSLEDSFGIEIEQEALGSIESIGDIVDLLVEVMG